MIRTTEIPANESQEKKMLFHDVNNSLSSIGMNIQYLTDGDALTGEMLEAAREIREEVATLTCRLEKLRAANREIAELAAEPTTRMSI